MMRFRIQIVLIVAAMTAGAYADDYDPPPWRGGPCSVEAHWKFDTESAFAPNPYNTVGGDGCGELHGTEPRVTDPATTGFTWHDGAWKNDGDEAALMYFYLPNWMRELDTSWKDIRFQIAYDGAAPSVFRCYGFGDQEEYESSLVADLSYAGHFVQDWRISPNPWHEEFIFDVPVGTSITQVVIDTRCIPGPAALSLLGLGGLALVRRRRS